MALYWPEEKVALDIVDDPYRRPFEGDESYTVLRVTCAELCDYDSYHRVMHHLCDLLGKDLPDMPAWEDSSRILHQMLCSTTPGYEDVPSDDYLSNIEILATSEEDAERMREAARDDGRHVRGVSVWDGPVPKGSFEIINDSMRMSTPEYFFLRKANQLPFAAAVSMGIELCGKYRTILTQYDRADGYDFLKQPRTSTSRIRRYLRDTRGTKEGKRAKRVLRLVANECSSPMGCYLYLLFCLPASYGGYGFERAALSGTYDSDDGLMPSATGTYLAYDLVWPNKRVVVQYTGKKAPTPRQLEALQAKRMSVICVTDKDVSDPQAFDVIAHELAELLGTEVPEPTEKWQAQCKRLRRQVEQPTFDHMRLTIEDISEHL